MVKTTDDDSAANSDEHLRQQRPAYIARIAVLSEHCDRLLEQLKDAGIAAVREPKVDEVRPAILAEGVVAEMNRLRAELRICEEDLAAADQMVDDLRHQLDLVKVSQAGVGQAGRPRPPREAVELEPTPFTPDATAFTEEPTAVTATGESFMPAEDDPALKHQQTFLAPAGPAGAPAPKAAKTKAKAAKPRRTRGEKRTPAMRVLAFLVERGSGANVRFITKALGMSYAATEKALNELLAAGRLQKSDLAGFVQWKAIA